MAKNIDSSKLKEIAPIIVWNWLRLEVASKNIAVIPSYKHQE
jgi:hypothetical protein